MIPIQKKFYKLILNGVLRVPDPESAIKKISGGNECFPPKKIYKLILNGVLRVPDPESEIKKFWGGEPPPPPKNFFLRGHLKRGFEGP